VVEPRISAYLEASRAVFEVFEQTTPLVEGLSIDEAFLDVGGLRRVSGTPIEIAARLRRDVLERVGLPITVGVARTKFLAKVASGVAKPNGLLVVPPDNELGFLHPLPIERLWGVGPVTASKLRDQGITTVGEVALMGGAVAGQDPGSGLEEVDAALVALVDRVTRRMRAAGRVGRTVVLRLRFDDFSRATRSHTLSRATAHTETILATARGLLATAMSMIDRQGLTLVGVAVSNLDDEGGLQLVLPFDRHSISLDEALDDVRERFGPGAVTRAVLLGREPGLTVPLLPD
jgi:DNA polymerase-4